MTVKLKFLSERIFKLPKTSPKLWKNSKPELDDYGQPILTLNHPILSKLESCTNLNHFNQVHAQLLVTSLFQHSLAASRAVKKLCSSDLLDTHHALRIYNSLEEPDAFICNTIIGCQMRMCHDPLKGMEFYYECMVRRQVLENHYTFPIILKAITDLLWVREGEKIHGRVLKHGYVLDLYVMNSLIRMYSMFKRVQEARSLFDESSVRDLVTWNSIIDGYVKNGEVAIARDFFDFMYEKDAFSWNSMVAGYVGAGDMEKAKELFEKMPCRDVVTWNCMIDGYSRTENVSSARELFDQMPARNVVSWNTVLALYVRVKYFNECLRLFDVMMKEGEVNVMPNDATLMSVLSACANLGELDRGKWVHRYMASNRIQPDVLLSTALLTMYSKCGAMNFAQEVFDAMPEKSIVSWNSMIMGYGLHGQGDKALEVFLEMEKKGQLPNDSTFICALSACTHSGMVLEGWWLFNRMQRFYNMNPKVEHYGCMVDLLGRAGLLKDSEDLISKMPMEGGPALWGALLSACSSQSNLQFGELVARRLIDLEPRDIAPFVLLSNIYASEGKWNDLENMRKMMKQKGLHKSAGLSQVHSTDFASQLSLEDLPTHRKSMVYSLLSEMGTQMKLSIRDTNR